MAGHVHQQSDHLRGAQVVRARLPLLVRSAWVPDDDGRGGVILVDDRLDDRDACAAIVEVVEQVRRLADEAASLCAAALLAEEVAAVTAALGALRRVPLHVVPTQGGTVVPAPVALATMSRAELRRALLARLFGRGAA